MFYQSSFLAAIVAMNVCLCLTMPVIATATVAQDDKNACTCDVIHCNYVTDNVASPHMHIQQRFTTEMRPKKHKNCAIMRFRGLQLF